VRFVKVVVCYRLEPAAGSVVAQQWVDARLHPRAFYLMVVYGKLRILSTHLSGWVYIKLGATFSAGLKTRS